MEAEGDAGDDGLVAAKPALVFLPAELASWAGLAAWRGRKAYRVSQSCEACRRGERGYPFVTCLKPFDDGPSIHFEAKHRFYS